MQEFFVKLNSIEDIKAFVVMATTQPFEVMVQTEGMSVSGKSFMGMFSLSYDAPVKITAKCAPECWAEFKKVAQRFCVEP